MTRILVPARSLELSISRLLAAPPTIAGKNSLDFSIAPIQFAQGFPHGPAYKPYQPTTAQGNVIQQQDEASEKDLTAFLDIAMLADTFFSSDDQRRDHL